MEESTDVCVAQNRIHNVDDVNILAELNSPDISPHKRSRILRNDDSSDEDATPVQKNRKRVQHLSESDTEKENVQTDNNRNEDLANRSGSESDISDISVPFHSKSKPTKSRIQLGASSSDSDTKERETMKNEEQQIRMKNKSNKLKQKFKGLLSSRTKHGVSQNLDNKVSSDNDNSESGGSDNELTSITSIKEKIKKSMTGISSICDPDTSDEESNVTKKTLKQKPKRPLKSTKMIEAKPIRMSAKQAMENMQLIKSESNRMLREKAVSLPYHRPKALSLKDIMSRRKPAVASDGKALPIKMNGEQLKQYAMQLEQRQKEMMELCKSESDEEDTAEPELNENLEEPTPKNTENGEDIIETNIEGQCDIVKDTNELNMDVENKVTVEINTHQPDSEIISSETVEKPDTNVDIEKENELVNTEPNKNDSNTSLKLVYNDDSIEEENVALEKTGNILKEDEITNKNPESNVIDKTASEEVSVPQEQIQQVFSEQDSQLISLQYTETATEESSAPTNVLEDMANKNDDEFDNVKNNSSDQMAIGEDDKQDDFFSDDDVDMDDIDKIIENAEIMKENVDNINSPLLIKDTLTIKPKLTGGPGMIIDLDSTDTLPKRSGIELLKERFTYFAKLKTPEEMEREKEKRLKPGAQHLKLKQELEEKIAEQRSIEWAKRLEEEKQLHQEMDAILDDGEDADDSIEKIEAKLDEQEEKEEGDSESEEEEELLEDDIEIKDKPRKHNPMVDDEAVESDDENDPELEKCDEADDDVAEGDDIVEDDNNDESSEDEESSESEEEEEQTSKPKKGRIIKAFEDSDDEDDITKLGETKSGSKDTEVEQNKIETADKDSNEIIDVELIASSCEVQGSSQDDVIQLAQRHKSASDDLFTSQESATLNLNKDLGAGDEMLGTQTFSISSAKPSDFLCPSQPCHDPSLNGITDGLSQSVIGSQLPATQSSQSQPIGEDILALCTGNFYDNEFVSESNENIATEPVIESHLEDSVIAKVSSREIETVTASEKINLSMENNSNVTDNNKYENSEKNPEESVKKVNKDEHLKDILDELDDPEFDKPKPNIFFTGATQKKDALVESSQMKKRLVIDSDDETNETNIASEGKKKKKLKKKKLEKRALQISDDEDDGEEGFGLEDDDDVSDLEDDTERLVEYDSEENEIEVKPDKPKKKRKGTDFFEQEAELTSEDEWVGSGDEDEHGLDRMEREEGDDDVFHQGKLRKELGQIHMRDVLDQDKREVRLLQELLFEDGDLGGGHRQRKFRWRNEGDDEAGTVPDDFTDTQEEEFESEEQWRKQRHEREVFLRQMQNQPEDQESANVTVNRTTIIKANLISKSMSTLLMEANQSKTEVIENPVVPEKKTVKDVPSPKKTFSILQQNYHSSLLTRGRGALARLAALATPLAADDDAPKMASLASRKRNFVFATLTQEEEQPKVTIKRKADVNLGTPKLVKKMRTEEKQSHQKNSLLDHFNT